MLLPGEEAVLSIGLLVELFTSYAGSGHHGDYQQSMSRQVYLIFRLNLLGDVMLPAEGIVHITGTVNAHTLQSVINEEALSMI